jgi:tRNA (guanine-N7-)-methyltransferase
MTATTAPPAASHIRSFVRRGGRLTAAQQRALNELWPRFGLDYAPQLLDLDAAFGRHAARVLEIGFGNGDTLVQLAASRPDQDFLGIEVHPPGVGHCLLGIDALGLSNVRVSRHDAIDVLTQQIPDAGLDEVLLYFPDPWPKKRHHKRRIVQPAFVALVARKLGSGGVLRLATDWAPYAESMREVLAGCTELENAGGAEPYVTRPASRPLTRFERRGQRLGHEVFDLAFRRR